MAELIQKTDTLNEGRVKLNEAITDAETAKNISEQADDKATQALANSESTQTQLDTIVIDGDSSVEAAQARVDEKGGTHPTLKARIDDGFEKTTAQLADTDKQRFFESLVSRKEPGLICSWVDDDGRAEVYSRFKQILLDYGIPITSAIIPDRVINSTTGTYLSPEQVRELSGLGMEFLSHTNSWDSNDRPINWTESRLDQDFRESQQMVRNLGGNPRGLVLPYGDNSPLIQKVARRYYDYMIGTGSNMSGYPQYPGEIDNYYIWRVTVEYGFDFVKQQLDEAKSKGIGWVVFVSHIFDNNWYSDAYVRQVIDYALSLGFEFVTTREGVDRMGNIAQFGDTKIGADGTINSDTLGKVRHVGYREVDTDTPVDYFPNNAISITKIRSLDSENFPIQESGILETHKLDEDVYAYQRYTSTRNKHIHMRFWDVNAGNWTEWERANVARYLGLNALKPTDSPLLAHLRYSITHTIINAQGNEGFPENKSGTLINYALTYDNFPFQEYYIYQESKVYKRYWNGSSWSTWRKVQDQVGAQYSFPNLLLTNTPASDFDQGITVAYITGGANDSGLPNGATSGNFITVKETGGQGRTYQEFRQYNTFNKFMRIEQNDGTWSGWKKFILE